MLAEGSVLVLGLVLLLGGGETVVRGSTRLAGALGVSPLVIGLTVVAFGTSAPELAVNMIAVWRGRGAISFGNIIGSNMANIGLIVGCTALIRPILIGGVVVRRELPMMLLGTAAAIIMAFDGPLRDMPAFIDRSDGMILLLLFLVFLYYTVGDFVRRRSDDQNDGQVGVFPEVSEAGGVAKNLLLTALGLAALLGGAHYTVDAASNIARSFGIPEVVIGLTVLAIGTSLPELVASVMATMRGHVELAIGNVVGSNIFNLLLVAGLTALLRPIPVPAGGMNDLMVVLLLSVLLLFVSLTRSRYIVRSEAATLLGIYLAYMAWRSFLAR